MFFQKLSFYLFFILSFFGLLSPTYSEEEPEEPKVTTVSSLTPLKAKAEEETTFTVRGQNLNKNVRLMIDGCGHGGNASNFLSHLGDEYGALVSSVKKTYKCIPAYFPDNNGGITNYEIRDNKGNLFKSGTIDVAKKEINHHPTTPKVNAPSSANIGQKISISVQLGTDEDGDLVQVRCGIERSQYDDDYPYEANAYQSSFQTGGSTVTIDDVIFDSSGNAIIRCVSFDKVGLSSGVGSDQVDIPYESIVSNMSPTVATYEKLTTFTITGEHLPDTLAAHIDDCKDPNGLSTLQVDHISDTKQTFQCIPSYTTGNKNYIIKDKPNGTLLKSGTLLVIEKVPDKFNLTLHSDGNGSLTIPQKSISCTNTCSEIFNKGDTVTVTNTPDIGYNFKQWSGACSGSSPCNITMNANTVVRAIFEKKNTPTLSLRIDNISNGTVISSNTNINCGNICSDDIGVNNLVRLEAIPNEGYIFSGWDECTGNNDCSFLMTTDKSVTAIFTEKPKKHTITILPLIATAKNGDVELNPKERRRIRQVLDDAEIIFNSQSHDTIIKFSDFLENDFDESKFLGVINDGYRKDPQVRIPYVNFYRDSEQTTYEKISVSLKEIQDDHKEDAVFLFSKVLFAKNIIQKDTSYSFSDSYIHKWYGGLAFNTPNNISGLSTKPVVRIGIAIHLKPTTILHELGHLLGLSHNGFVADKIFGGMKTHLFELPITKEKVGYAKGFCNEDTGEYSIMYYESNCENKAKPTKVSPTELYSSCDNNEDCTHNAIKIINITAPTFADNNL